MTLTSIPIYQSPLVKYGSDMKSKITPQQQKLAQSLLYLLERISADSHWAHRASGVRASLAKALDDQTVPAERIGELIGMGFDILEKAAREIPED